MNETVLWCPAVKLGNREIYRVTFSRSHSFCFMTAELYTTETGKRKWLVTAFPGDQIMTLSMESRPTDTYLLRLASVCDELAQLADEQEAVHSPK
jgi:hypothetical protein